MKPAARVAMLLMLWAICSSALAYERETHFDLTLYLALKAPCFDLADALLIASSDLSQDTNSSMVAEKDFVRAAITLDVPNQGNWHALGLGAEVDARRLELWERVRTEPLRLKRLHYLGQLLHFDQDSFAHAGFLQGLGHALPTFFGHDPDSLAYPDRGQSALAKTNAALLSSLVWLEKTCEIEGSSVAPEFSGADLKLFETLVNLSDPVWRVWQLGGLTQAGARIQLELRRQIAAALPENRLTPALATSNDRTFVIDRLLEWLHVRVDFNGEMQNGAELSDKLAWIRQGGLPN
jgi:hypothetical protein